MLKSLFIGLSFTAITLTAQIKAITENGDEVMLYENGTWKSQAKNSQLFGTTEIPQNSVPFKKDVNSTFLLKSKVVNVGVWLNPTKWTISKGNEPQEYQFTLKGESVYGMMITEKVEFPLETLKRAALTNAQNASADLELVREEYRTVNGLKVLMMQLEGTLQGIKFDFYGYYYSTSQGSVQLITWTVKDLYSSQQSEMEKLLNGIVVFSN
jgi:hypothetical protein